MSPAGPPPPPRVAGLGTIVGSAVFNVLFVIAACALAADGDLKLTWWPLARDTCFYSVVRPGPWWETPIHVRGRVLVCTVVQCTVIRF